MFRHYFQMIKGNIFQTRGALVVAVASSFISLYVIGFIWTVILGMSIVLSNWALKKIDSEDQNDDGRNSFENIYNNHENDSKQKRMFAKKKERYKKRRVTADDNSFDHDEFQHTILDNSFLSKSMNSSVPEDFDAEYTQSRNLLIDDRINCNKTRVPSLRSPQPLISEVKSRICRRDSKTKSPFHPFGNSYPAHHQRRVLKNVQNERSVALFDMINGSVLAKSPASGQYFSRINPEQNQDHIQSSKSSPFLFSMQQLSCSEQTKMKAKYNEDPCSTASVIKALQEKTASKRKRTIMDQSDTTLDVTTEEFENCNNKKRRLENVATSTVFNDAHPNNLKDYMKKRFISQSILSKPSTGVSKADGNEKSKRDNADDIDDVSKQKKVKYGIDESDIEQLEDNDQEVQIANEKKKQNVKSPKMKSKGEKNESRILKSRAKASLRKTPVKSVETQTPTKLAENGETNSSLKSPRTPKQLKTPYKRIFASGFPSNLKPGSTEKRRKISVRCTFGDDLESVDIAREEYGERGVTYSAYQAEKEAAARRVNDLLNDDDDDVNDNKNSNQATHNAAQSVTTAEKSITSQFGTITTTTSASKSPTFGNLTNAFKPNSFAFGESPITTSSKTSQENSNPTTDKPCIQIGNSAKESFASTLTSSNADLMQKLNTPSSTMNLNTVTPLHGSIATSKVVNAMPVVSSVSTEQSSLSSQNFTIKVTSTAAVVPSQAAPTVSTQMSTFTGFSFNSFSAKPDLSNVTPNATPSISVSPIAVSSSSSFEKTQASSGFSFAAAIKSNANVNNVLPTAQIVPKATNIVTSLPATTSFGFSFGTPVQSSASTDFGIANAPINTNLLKTTSSALPSSGIQSFTFKTPAFTSTSNTVASANTFSSISSLNNQPVAITPATTSLPGGFSFKQSAPAKTQASLGGFSFGATTSINAQSPFSFGTTSSMPNTTQQTPFSFGSHPAGESQPFGSVFGAKPATNTATTTTPSMFGLQPANVQGSSSLFGNQSQVSTASKNLFGAAVATAGSVFGQATQLVKTTGSIFGTPSQTPGKSVSSFGAANSNLTSGSAFTMQGHQSQPTASLFGTTSSTSTFSFGANNTNPFGAVAAVSQNPSSVSQKSTAGGFSFSSSLPSTTKSANQNMFGQTTVTTKTGFSFGQSNLNANPFGSGSSFKFGQNTQQAFGQSSQPGFGGATQGTQKPGEGFNFAGSLQKPASFSFAAGSVSGGGGGGFSSRPGTPTPLASNQATVNPSSSLFGSQQPSSGGFTIGASSAGTRQQLRGRRRPRK